MLLRSSSAVFDEPQLFTLADDVLLAAWDGAEEADDARGATGPRLEELKLTGPRATLRLLLPDAITRTALAVRQCEYPAIAAGLRLPERAAAEAAACSEAGMLIEGLGEATRSSVLDFLLGICRSTFRLSNNPRFAAFCRGVAESAVTGEPLALTAFARLSPGYALCRGPAAVGAAQAIYALAGQQVLEVLFRPAAAPAADRGAGVILTVPEWVFAPGLRTLAVGAGGAHLVQFTRPENLPGIVALAERGRLRDEERGYALRCLALTDDAEAAAAARALQILAPQPARRITDAKGKIAACLELSASCGRAGVLVRGWIRDPHRLVADAELISPFGRRRLAADWQRQPRPDLAKAAGPGAKTPDRPGFIALVPIEEPIPVLQHRLSLVTAGGPIEISSPANPLTEMELRDTVLRCLGPEQPSEAMLSRIVAPAVAALHQRAMARRIAAEVIDIGTPAANPAVSIIVPLYRNLSFLKPQVGAFCIDPEVCCDAELIYVLDSPEQRDELEHLLRGLQIATGLSFRLLVMAENRGYAAANNAGVAAGRGRQLMLLNSDVVPIAAGWLGRLRAGLETAVGEPAVAAVGPKLLFDDGSLQHAGLTFERDGEGRWYNTHFFKGYPRDWPAANRPGSVPAITGAAMLLPRAAYEAVDGFSEDYVVGDYEDSDLCLKLRSRGYDIRYEPRAELYHFERRSIGLHAGYNGTAASAYNRRLHSERWSGLMAELTDMDPAATTPWRRSAA